MLIENREENGFGVFKRILTEYCPLTRSLKKIEIWIMANLTHPYLRTTLHIARGSLPVGGFVLPQLENVSTVVANTLPSSVKEPTNYTDINNKLDDVKKAQSNE